MVHCAVAVGTCRDQALMHPAAPPSGSHANQRSVEGSLQCRQAPAKGLMSADRPAGAKENKRPPSPLGLHNSYTGKNDAWPRHGEGVLQPVQTGNSAGRAAASGKGKLKVQILASSDVLLAACAC